MVGNPAQATLVSVPTGFYFPTMTFANLGDNANVALTIDAAAEKVAMVCRVPKSGTISKIYFRVNAVTTNDTLYGVINTVLGTGFPSTVGYGGMSTGTVVTSGAGVYSVTLVTGATAVLGDEISVIVGFNSYVAGNMTISTIQNETATRLAYPYVAHFTASWSKAISATPAMWLEYSDGSYSFIPTTLTPAATNPFLNTSYNRDSTPDEYAVVFTPTFNCRAAGFAAELESSAGGDFSAVLYSGTVGLATATVDGDSFGQTGSAFWYTGVFPTAVNLTAGQTYRLGIKPSQVANVILHRFVSYSTSSMDQSFGGATVYESTRTDAGSWTDNTSARPFISVYLDQVDDGTGTGGGKSVIIMD